MAQNRTSLNNFSLDEMAYNRTYLNNFSLGLDGKQPNIFKQL